MHLINIDKINLHF